MPANNQLRSEQLTTNISQTLRNNRRILKTLCPQGKATVRKNVLDEMGYDFSLFTSLFLTQNRQVYYLCYDYGLAPLSDDHGVKRVLIISRQPYMTGWDPWKHLRKPDENKSVPGNT